MEKNSVAKFLDPEAIIAQIEVESGSLAADFGCGPGYFTLPFARLIGEDGKIFAFDVMPQVLETVLSKAKSMGLTNVVAKRVNLEKEKGSELDDEYVDWVILKDMLFQNQDKKAIIKEAHRVLSAGGQALVVEWNGQNATIGPDLSLRIAERELEKMFESEDFKVTKKINAGDFHYAFVTQKN